MTQDQFIYWLQGMLEYTKVSELSHMDALFKLQGIKDHIKLVLTKVTPFDTRGFTTPIIPKPLAAPIAPQKIPPHIEWPHISPTPYHPNEIMPINYKKDVAIC